MFSIHNLGSSSIVSHLIELGTQLATSNERLTTGYRVNRASDDPSGIIAATKFSAEIARIDGQLRNAQRISSIVDTADAALTEISTLMGTIETAQLAAAGAATEEDKAAYQAEIDTAIDAIDTLVNTTSFNNTNLLDGSYAYTVSGVDSDDLADVRVKSTNHSDTPVTYTVEAVAATKAEISYGGANPVADVIFTLTGPNGSAQITWQAGQSKATLAALVNLETDSTGIESEYNTYVYFRPENAGEGNNVEITFQQGSLTMRNDNQTVDYGADATATINGASTSVSGSDAYYTSGNTSISLTLADSFTAGTTNFTVRGNGTDWALGTSAASRINFGQVSLRSTNLGNGSLGYLSSLKSGGENDIASENYSAGAAIIQRASSQVAADQGRWGAIKSCTIESSTNSLTVAKTAMETAKSNIIDLDYIAETANNERLQILMDAGITALTSSSLIASNVLSILSTVNLLS
jgi:flagellin